MVFRAGIWNPLQHPRRRGRNGVSHKILCLLSSKKVGSACGRVPFVARQKEPKACRGSAWSRWTGPLAQVHIPALPPVPHGRLNKRVPGLIQGLLSKFPRRGGSAALPGSSPARASQALPFSQPLACRSTANIRRAASWMNISAIKGKERKQRQSVHSGGK